MALIASSVPTAVAQIPAGPHVAFMKWGPGAHSLSILSIDPNGLRVRRVAGGGGRRMPQPLPFNGPSWSPDGSLLAFHGQVVERPARIFVVAPDGGVPRAIPGTTDATNPVLSPDGGRLAFARTRSYTPPFDPDDPLKSLRGSYFSTTTWILDLATGHQKRLTSWRNGFTVLPSSFSPDGSTLGVSRTGPRGYEAVALSLGNGRATVLARNAEEPMYSPDGSRIALISYRDRNTTEGFDGPVLQSELYVKRVGQKGLSRVTRTPERQESSPSWDPSGERLAYVQSSEPESLGFTNVIRQVNPDGTCSVLLFGNRRPILEQDIALFGPAWQPGPGREAGRIAC